jgi:hypothetical protein
MIVEVKAPNGAPRVYCWPGCGTRGPLEMGEDGKLRLKRWHEAHGWRIVSSKKQKRSWE